MAGIFVCYRRNDTAGYAGRLVTSLAGRFGHRNVFHDIRTPPGRDFIEEIEIALNSCAAVLVLIGHRWVEEADLKAREGDDIVSMEVATALSIGIPVIPVLLDGAEMPKASELPGDIQSLSRRQAQDLSSNRWDYDVRQLIQILETIPKLRRQVVWNSLNTKAAVAIAVVMAVAAALAYSYRSELLNGLSGSSETVEPSANDAQVNKSPQQDLVETREDPEERERERLQVARDQAQETQRILNEMGFYAGAVNGIVSDRASRAIVGFQRSRGLDQTGSPSDSLLDALRDARDTGWRNFIGCRDKSKERQECTDGRTETRNETHEDSSDVRWEWTCPYASKFAAGSYFNDNLERAEWCRNTRGESSPVRSGLVRQCRQNAPDGAFGFDLYDFNSTCNCSQYVCECLTQSSCTFEWRETVVEEIPSKCKTVVDTVEVCECRDPGSAAPGVTCQAISHD